MKSILLPVQPKWCELIASGKKTVEIRKFRLETPFKVYIYQTKKTWVYDIYSKIADWQGKVIGEFICDYVLGHCEMANADIAEQQGCMHREQLLKYSNGKEVYGLHISDLKIYDEPMKLDEFHKPCSAIKNCPNGNFRDAGRSLDKCFDCGSRITRPPQSYCYVEELTNG